MLWRRRLTEAAAQDADENRHRRRDGKISIRKDKRAEQLAKRRTAPEAAPAAPLADAANAGGKAAVVTIEDLPQIIAGIKSGVKETVLAATRNARKLLSKEKNPPIDEVIAAGLVPVFIQMLGCEQVPQLQFEAAWVRPPPPAAARRHSPLLPALSR